MKNVYFILLLSISSLAYAQFTSVFVRSSKVTPFIFVLEDIHKKEIDHIVGTFDTTYFYDDSVVVKPAMGKVARHDKFKEVVFHKIHSDTIIEEIKSYQKLDSEIVYLSTTYEYYWIENGVIFEKTNLLTQETMQLRDINRDTCGNLISYNIFGSNIKIDKNEFPLFSHIEYNYNNNGKLRKILIWAPSEQFYHSFQQTVEFEYNSNGELTKVNYYYFMPDSEINIELKSDLPLSRRFVTYQYDHRGNWKEARVIDICGKTGLEKEEITFNRKIIYKSEK